eukprot:6490176-Amphidinium_carterae.1
MHKVLAKAFHKVFATTLAEEEVGEDVFAEINIPAEEAQVEDEMEKIRKERKATAKRALIFLEHPDAMNDLLLMMHALEPQQKLMHAVLHESSLDAELKAQRQFIDDGRLRSKLQLLVAGELQQTLFTESLAVCLDMPRWSLAAETEYMRSEVFRVSMRPAATIFELVFWPSRGLPCALFRILGAAEREVIAEELLNIAPCMRDRFTNGFLTTFPSVESLASEDAQQVLAAIALEVQTTTYSTERCHSKNLRRSKTRVQCTHADPKFLGMPHIAYA